jgi:hemoglobin-like flavoprotein
MRGGDNREARCVPPGAARPPGGFGPAGTPRKTFIDRPPLFTYPEGMSREDTRTSAGKKETRGLLHQMFSFLLESSDPEREKKRLLKEIARTLRHAKPRRYNPKTETAEPALARLFFEFYRTLGPAQRLLSHADSSKLLKTVLIEKYFSREQQALKERLSEESLKQRAADTPPQQLALEAKEELQAFFAFFDGAKAQEINASYRDLAALIDLANFDYYFLLKKFDSRLQEGVFDFSPQFEAINALYVEEELKEFLDLFAALDPAADFGLLLSVLTEYRGVEMIPAVQWKRLLHLIRQLQKSEELLLILRLISGKPTYRARPAARKENITEAFLANFKMQTELTVQKIGQEKTKKKIDELVEKVFGSPPQLRLSWYTEKANIAFSKKMLGGYIHILPLGYLKAFLLDFVKKDLRQLVDLLVITGKWKDHNQTQILSEEYHQLLTIADEILEFDESLKEDGDYGRKIQAVIIKADKNQQALTQLRYLLKKINEQAQGMIVRASQHFVVLGKLLKQLAEEPRPDSPVLIMNWRELDAKAGRSAKQLIIPAYNHIYYFVRLLKALV